jgi:hypothetical protein
MPFSRRTAVLGAIGGPLVLSCSRRLPEAEPTPRAATITRRWAATKTSEGRGATVARLFPTPELRHLDPFVLLDHFDVREPAAFPDHPHRGFEAFTYMLEGSFEHRDDLGNESIVHGGGIQRFSSGRGARHSEMPGSGPTNAGLQLWVNLPRRLKQMDPDYAGHQGDALPLVEEEGQRTRTIVGVGSPAGLRTDVDYRDVTLQADATWSADVPDGWSALAYVLEGEPELCDTAIARGQAILVSAGRLKARARRQPVRFAFLAGRPHHEPIRHRGPFVD